jgi:mannose-6-phosphate isomerase-like protein (cupin superfamily)
MGPDPTPVQPSIGRLSVEVPTSGETFHELASPPGVRIEHIVSSDSADPTVQVQDWDEWVIVISGGATLDVAGQRVDLAAGEWMLLPACTPHQVLATQSGTHWIAVHGARSQPADGG